LFEVQVLPESVEVEIPKENRTPIKRLPSADEATPAQLLLLGALVRIHVAAKSVEV